MCVHVCVCAQKVLTELPGHCIDKITWLGRGLAAREGERVAADIHKLIAVVSALNSERGQLSLSDAKISTV